MARGKMNGRKMNDNTRFFCRTGIPKGVRIEVMADSLRVGKTTAVKVIGEGLRRRGLKVEESYEDWQHNPFLKESYSDPAKNFLESQKWFAKRKWEQIWQAHHEQVQEGVNGKVFIQDVAPEMDYNYAVTNMKLGRMSGDDFKEYDRFFKDLNWVGLSVPTLIIYLKVSDEELIERALASKREFETIEEDYYLMMKRVNREWLKEVGEKMKILQVETDELDFSRDEGAKLTLVQRVMESLDG